MGYSSRKQGVGMMEGLTGRFNRIAYVWFILRVMCSPVSILVSCFFNLQVCCIYYFVVSNST